ncbi:SNF2 family N-terminal domain-containing protein [Dactylonectria estremocensis]|uniref:SNF2 family N-terminal domain-containing protein n=1 Tax=Dactylonectria estremocensis TaxID=1079267 RepID=A0A9P9EFE6_9HYPO|nr:SNF2 family N-terminal domain-containing protein [Dactylonectria estremocensis]
MEWSAESFPHQEIDPVLAVDVGDEVEQICYGMIHNVDVKLIGDMPGLLGQLNQSEGLTQGCMNRFTLLHKIGHVMLLLPNGTEFGHPRGNITEVISSLQRLENLKLDFEAVASTNVIFQKMQKVTKQGDAIVQVDINIYGPCSRGNEVGDKLTEKKVWLQKPDYAKRGFAYVNPHEIRFPDLQGSERLEELERELLQPERAKVDVMEMVSEVQQSTHRAARLERVEGDRRLRTKLLEHQEKGLAFMSQRESGQVPEEFRLWEPRVVEGTEMYFHRITKSRSVVQPPERGGGVLADEMGMGKTLSILALIIKTVEEGYSWAEERRTEELIHSEIQQHAHSTLVIVPSALIINSWVNEIDMHLGDAVKVIKYHGDGRERRADVLSTADIVLTTYKTLATDFFSKKKTQSILHSIGWFRIVLDEAHNIRRPATSFHRACANLTARSRWCLTGTPIQNKLEDIGALFVFLKAEQFQTMAKFRAYLVFPFEQQDPVAKERLVMLYDSLVLRRTKDILDLPGQEERIRELELSPRERSQYNKTTEILDRYIRQQVGEHDIRNKFGLFQAHLQLRILCNHGTHQKLFAWKRKSQSVQDEKEAILAELGLNAERICAGCGQPRPIINSNNAQSDFVEKCAHILCRDCLDGLDGSQAATGPLKHCPLCDMSRKSLRKTATSLLSTGVVDNSRDVVMRDIDGDEDDDAYFNLEGYSKKMTALVQDVKETLGDIIFSCWTRTLDLIEVYLKKENIKFLRVDGECLMSKRQQILDRFSRPSGARIMLMTTGIGAFGLNLTAASRIFIVELQWNPSVENQAIARAIRLRQRDKVIVTRYMMLGTIEQEMKSQQVKKKRAAKIGFTKSGD